MSVCMYEYAPCAYSALVSQERELDPFKLKLQTGVSHQVGDGNCSHLLYKTASGLNHGAPFPASV